MEMLNMAKDIVFELALKMRDAFIERGFESKIHVVYNVKDVSKIIKRMNTGDILYIDEGEVEEKSISLIKYDDIGDIKENDKE
jgi:hypothetical protein